MTAGAPLLHLEDLAPGQRFEGLGRHALDKAQILAYARQFDPQPFHLDPEAAQDTLFNGLAASGWHTAALTMRLMVDGGVPLAWGLIGAQAEVRWPTPTRPGDVLRVESEVLEVRPSRSKPDRGLVKVRTLTLNQRAEVLQELVATMVVPRRTAEAGPDAAD